MIITLAYIGILACVLISYGTILRAIHKNDYKDSGIANLMSYIQFSFKAVSEKRQDIQIGDNYIYITPNEGMFIFNNNKELVCIKIREEVFCNPHVMRQLNCTFQSVAKNHFKKIMNTKQQLLKKATLEVMR